MAASYTPGPVSVLQPSSATSNAASLSNRSWTSGAFSEARSHEYPNIPGESALRPAKPFARTDSGVSLKRKNSYSEAHLTENPIARAFCSTFCSTPRGETGISKSSRNAAVASSQGMRRYVDRSTVACASGYPVCQPVTEAVSYSASPLSHPKITSQKPRPLSAAPQNLSSDTYFPRSTPSTSNPPSFTLRISCLRNSSGSCSISPFRGFAASMAQEREGSGAARQGRPG